MKRNYINIVFSRVFLLAVTFLVEASAAGSKEQPVARTVIALYTPGKGYSGIRNSSLHQYAEMPLNHLGIKLEYHNVTDPLPEIADRPDVRGVITWFNSASAVEKPLEYLKWAGNVMKHKKRFVIIGDTGFGVDKLGKATSASRINQFFSHLGIKDTEKWISRSYQAVAEDFDPGMMEFERKYDLNKPGYPVIQTTKLDVKTHYSLRTSRNSKEISHLVVTCPRGGYIAPNYAANVYSSRERAMQWYVNPFEFFRRAFATDEIPKPDISTLAGRRIFFSHIDCDGWNSVSLVEKYKEKRAICGEVLLNEILKPYPHLPVNVAIVAGDIALDWHGTPNSRKVAKEVYSLKHIEAGSHSYTHPFQWSFFENYSVESEAKYMHKYQKLYAAQQGTNFEKMINRMIKADKKEPEVDGALLNNYEKPRAYGKEPFSLEHDIVGSFKEIETLLPPGKKVKVMMWTGDTSPFEAALRMTRESGVQNINGGDSRFDTDFPSYIWVAPIGRQVGSERQIYAVNSNENTYTDLWFNKFHGFKYLPQTLKNTEEPFRIKPIHIYYHSYTGERDASLNALISNLKYVESQEICPIEASRYCTIASGFYSVQLNQVAPLTWKILNRNTLQTIRFDRTEHLTVNYTESNGIVGHRYYQGNLYAYLDETVSEPLLKLKPTSSKDKISFPYLNNSRWRVFDLKREGNRFSYRAQGFGKGEMSWIVPDNGLYDIKINDKKKYTVDVSDGKLDFVIEQDGISGLSIVAQRRLDNK